MQLAQLPQLDQISRVVRQNTTSQHRAIDALLVGHPKAETEDRIFDLGEQIVEEYYKVGPIYGVPISPFLIQEAYRRTAKAISIRIGSVNSSLRRADGRRGYLTSSRGQQQALEMMNQSLGVRFIEWRKSKLAEAKHDERTRLAGLLSAESQTKTNTIDMITLEAPTSRKSRKKVGQPVGKVNLASVDHGKHLPSPKEVDLQRTDNERRGKEFALLSSELKRIARVAGGKRHFTEGMARKEFSSFQLWKSLDQSNIDDQRRATFFEEAHKFKNFETRFEFIGWMVGLAGPTAYDIYKQRPDRKRRIRKRSIGKS